MSSVTVYEARMALGGEYSPYRVHQRLWTLVQGRHGSAAANERPFLYRADSLEREWLVHVRLREPVATGFHVVPVGYEIAPGTRYRFEIRAVAEVREGSRVVRVFRDEAAGEWFARRAAGAGIDADVEAACTKGMRFAGGKGQKITLQDTLIRGALVVRDAQRFGHAICYGYGRHKGFGFGMFQLQREG